MTSKKVIIKSGSCRHYAGNKPQGPEWPEVPKGYSLLLRQNYDYNTGWSCPEAVRGRCEGVWFEEWGQNPL